MTNLTIEGEAVDSNFVPIELRDSDGRWVRFRGVRISEASSWESWKLRWFEIRIYKREDGGYVVHKVGRSVVYHLPGCETITGRVDLDMVDEPDGSRIPCPRCKPELSDDPVVLERDKSNIHESVDVNGMVMSLYQTDGDGIRFISKTARAALRFARFKDEAVMQMFVDSTPE
jgi:hypothetical protein